MSLRSPVRPTAPRPRHPEVPKGAAARPPAPPTHHRRRHQIQTRRPRTQAGQPLALAVPCAFCPRQSSLTCSRGLRDASEGAETPQLENFPDALAARQQFRTPRGGGQEQHAEAEHAEVEAVRPHGPSAAASCRKERGRGTPKPPPDPRPPTRGQTASTGHRPRWDPPPARPGPAPVGSPPAAHPRKRRGTPDAGGGSGRALLTDGVTVPSHLGLRVGTARLGGGGRTGPHVHTGWWGCGMARRNLQGKETVHWLTVLVTVRSNPQKERKKERLQIIHSAFRNYSQ